AGHKRLSDRVFRGVEVRRRVPVRRRVAAAHVAADEAQPQVQPGVARLQAVLAPLGAGRDGADLAEVRVGQRQLRPRAASAESAPPPAITSASDAPSSASVYSIPAGRKNAPPCTFTIATNLTMHELSA